MGTNFYWKEVPKELEQYKDTVINESVLEHIGKRSAGGLYCYNCGTTLCKSGIDGIHTVDNEENDCYKVCPVCGKEGAFTLTFRWTIMKHKWIVERLYNENCKEKLIVDDYGNEYTPMEFRFEVRTPIEFQECNEFR